MRIGRAFPARPLIRPIPVPLAATTVDYFLGIDIAAGGWTTSTGSGTLSSMVNESSPDNSNYIQSGLNPSSDLAELKFLNVSTPGATTGHIVSYTIKGDAATTLQVDLVCNVTIIKTWTHSPVDSVFTQYDQTVSGGEAATILDYPNLRLRVTAS